MQSVNAPTLHPPALSTRVHALDAARGAALLLGVVFHGIESLAFNKQFAAVQDSQSSTLLNVVYYSCHIFRMQAFFLMAGYFAHLLYRRLGLQGFLGNRITRLAVPFVLFGLVDYVLVVALRVWNIQRATGVPAREAFAQLPANYRLEHGWPMMHLWFLYFLLLYCGCAFVARMVMDRWPLATQAPLAVLHRVLAWAFGRSWGSLVLAVFMVGPMLSMSYESGVDTSNDSWVPLGPPFVVYGFYFALGWWLRRQPHALNNLKRFRATNLGLSVAVVGLLFTIKLAHDPDNLQTAAALVVATKVVYAFASMVLSFAFIGYMLMYFSDHNPRIRYLSDSAYWSYLIHFPLVIFFQILVAPYPWHWLIKVFLILTPTTIILLLTYHYGVRNTALGQLLNGRKYPPSASTKSY